MKKRAETAIFRFTSATFKVVHLGITEKPSRGCISCITDPRYPVNFLYHNSNDIDIADIVMYEIGNLHANIMISQFVLLSIRPMSMPSLRVYLNGSF